MENITKAARKHAGGDLDIIHPAMYDSFIAGATAPETEEYYKRKYSHIAGDNDCLSTNFDPWENARKEVIMLIAEGSLLRAVKVWKEANPGMGLKEAKEYLS